MRRAVVLGSGAVTGGGWQIGVLKGLGDAGLDLSEPDVFVGCSVGAHLALRIRSGTTIDEQYGYRMSPVRPADAFRSRQYQERTAADERYFRDCLNAWGAAREDIAARIELGTRAIDTPHPIPEDVQIEAKRRFGFNGWPPGDLRIAAVDVADGSVRFFDSSQEVSIEAALAATSAQPGLEAPITIDGRRYMDGGVAGTNIHGAADCEVVVAITAFPNRVQTPMEIEAVRADGGHVVHISPDGESRQAMGSDVTDRTRAKASAEAGRRQAADFVDAVRDLWRGA